MPLSIYLTTPQKTYLGTETLRGRVIFESSTLTHLSDIKISFTGTSKSKITKVKGAGAPAANYRSKCLLFQKEKILHHIPANANGEALPPGKYEWDFEFLFPTIASSVRGVKWPEKMPYRSDDGHPLPPTFAIEAGDEARRVVCGVCYRLEAKILKPQGGLFCSRTPLFTEELRLNFMPEFAISDEIDSGIGNEHYSHLYRTQKDYLFTIRSTLLLPENRGRSLTATEKIQGWLAPSQLPRFSFTASFSYPTRVAQGTPLDCRLDITPHLESSSVTTYPEIFMHSINITAISQTAARPAPSLMGSISAELDTRIEVLNKTSLRMAMPPSTNLGEVFGPLVLRHMDVSLRTFNIARTYRLCLSAVFECAGKTNEFRLDDLPFDIVARVESDSSEKKRLTMEFPPPFEDAPPMYTPSSARSARSLGDGTVSELGGN